MTNIGAVKTEALKRVVKEAHTNHLVNRYDMVTQYGSRLLVPENAIAKEDDEFATASEDLAEAEMLRMMAKEVAKGAEQPVSASKAKNKRASRDIKVFDVAEIERVRETYKAGMTDSRKRIEAGLKDAEKNNGYRTVPTFKSESRKLANLKVQFGNFAGVLDHYIEEFTLAGASRPDRFRVVPVLLDGDPGVGKTAFAQKMAEHLGVPYRKISAGGAQHASLLTGTASHWSNAQTGEIFNMIGRSELATAVLLIDEADKLTPREDYAILPALLDLLEPESSRYYKDESLNLRFDASRLIILMTSNKAAGMNDALLSRCRTFQIAAPDAEQRILIARITHDKILNGLISGNKHMELDMHAVHRLAEADINIRQINQSVRKAFAKAICQNDRKVVPEMPDPISCDEGEGYKDSRIGFGSRA